MKLKKSDLYCDLYTPDGHKWAWDGYKEYPEYRAQGFFRGLMDILMTHGEVSTEPYPREFKVGDRINNEQEALALPDSAVILDRNNVPNHKTTSGYWYAVDGQHLSLSGELNLPATILWMQDKEAQA